MEEGRKGAKEQTSARGGDERIRARTCELLLGPRAAVLVLSARKMMKAHRRMHARLFVGGSQLTHPRPRELPRPKAHTAALGVRRSLRRSLPPARPPARERHYAKAVSAKRGFHATVLLHRTRAC